MVQKEEIKPQKVFYFDNNDISNRVLLYGDDGSTLLFAPGWASTTYTWRNFIPYLSNHYRVHYFESREKPTCLRRGKVIDLSLEAMSNDLVSYANSLEDMHFLVGASIGASMVIEGWSKLKVKPKGVVLICPNLSARLPKFFGLIRILPSFVVRCIRPFALWCISKFSYRSDGERIAGMIRAMKAGDVDTLRQSASQLANIHLSPYRASAITVPTLVVGTLWDEIHNINHAVDVAEASSLGKMETLPTFADAHSSQCARLVHDWFSQI